MSFLEKMIKHFPCQDQRVNSCQFQSLNSPYVCHYVNGVILSIDTIHIIKNMVRTNNQTIPLMYLRHDHLIVKAFAKYLLKLPSCPFPRITK
jgi:hypothetical protein